MKQPIPLFKPKYRVEECLNEIRECFESNWTGLGYKTNEFEEAWKRYTGIKNAHFISSNSVGLQLALKVFGKKYNWKSQDEIITSPLTFVSTNHAILLEDLTPVFADVDDSLCIDALKVEQLITKRTKAIIFVGMGGNIGNLFEIIEICERNNIFLILDAAHMSGTYVDDKHIGRGIDCVIFSFQAVKNLPTADSGMICFDDSELDTLVRKFSWLGIDKDTYSRNDPKEGNKTYKWLYEVENLGLKANGNSVMAAIGLVQLKYLDIDNDIRRNISNIYDAIFENDNSVTPIPHSSNCKSSRHLYQIRVNAQDRDGLIEYLSSDLISVGVHYRSNTRYEIYKKYAQNSHYAEILDQEIISLPLHLDLSTDDLNRIGNQISRYLTHAT